MKHINLDREDEAIQRFVRSLPDDPEGSVLELHGVPVCRVLPPEEEKIDPVRLEAAIRNRREASRRLNEDWGAVDREAWEGPADGQE